MPKSTFDNLPEEKRQLITDIALEEFAALPYHQASLSRIVERAGIAKGSMYQYFEDKFDLYVYLVSVTADIKLRYVQKAMEELPPGADFYEMFLAATSAGLKMAADNPQLQLLGDRMLSESEEFLLKVMSRFGPAKDMTIDSWIRDAHTRGDIDKGVRPSTVSYLIQCIFMSMGRDMAAGRIPRDHVLGMVGEIFDILQHGMRPRAADQPGKRQKEGKQ